ncbi:MAG: hypothetical protein AVDCRST_MAG49-2030 [uncultured Thermomicrobiales bacterium]|uniref:Uncharacterized protein n=1 Tax=uncultured Thermomicrobiales bacterium TaxID=1645740 RepID=A0A6J4UNV0_9BACT|nr:MAG: hypothetical protein AVDCRST_MAG49-2030 [uncultured Thermomicrobiales bacterium]
MTVSVFGMAKAAVRTGRRPRAPWAFWRTAPGIAVGNRPLARWLDLPPGVSRTGTPPPQGARPRAARAARSRTTSSEIDVGPHSEDSGLGADGRDAGALRAESRRVDRADGAWIAAAGSGPPGRVAADRSAGTSPALRATTSPGDCEVDVEWSRDDSSGTRDSPATVRLGVNRGTMGGQL